MLQLAQKNTKTKETTKEEPQLITSLQEAEVYLRKVGEWNSVNTMSRDTILDWANFLKGKEISK